jgi:hypothetical protein
MARDSRAFHLSDAGHRVLFRENQLGFPGAQVLVRLSDLWGDERAG